MLKALHMKDPPGRYDMKNVPNILAPDQTELFHFLPTLASLILEGNKDVVQGD